MANLRYTIDETTHQIEVFDDENPNETGAPFLRQPTWPDGSKWATKDEAEGWAQATVTSFNDESAPLPGPNAAEPTTPRPDPVAGPLSQDPNHPVIDA